MDIRRGHFLNHCVTLCACSTHTHTLKDTYRRVHRYTLITIYFSMAKCLRLSMCINVSEGQSWLYMPNQCFCIRWLQVRPLTQVCGLRPQPCIIYYILYVDQQLGITLLLFGLAKPKAVHWSVIVDLTLHCSQGQHRENVCPFSHHTSLSV